MCRMFKNIEICGALTMSANEENGPKKYVGYSDWLKVSPALPRAG